MIESAARFLNLRARNGIEPGNLEMAVSAMTVHVRLQQEGYRAILF